MASSSADPAAAAAAGSSDYILTLSCPDKPGIVHAVTGVFASLGINIMDLQQYSDPDSAKFFMRVHVGPVDDAGALDGLRARLAALATQLRFDAHDLRPAARKLRVLILVSRSGHCLNDLLFRARAGQLRIDVAAVASNHADLGDLARGAGVAFHHLPVTRDTKAAQEARVLELVRQLDVELVVLARYMQVLSPALCGALGGCARIVNIHHSFLPSFKGARPYHQAYERGVKIIGATAHFVTADLDEGPIIEQRVVRVDHSMAPRDLIEEGSNVESQVLAAAVKWIAERRVFLNVTKTVVFN